jgi:hypothetical protein
MSKYAVHYFNFYGRGEPIRWLLSYGKIDFEDHRFEEDEWAAKIKESMINLMNLISILFFSI